jgi:hypothetical protein
MQTIRLLLSLAFAALAIYVAVTVYLEYLKAQGSTWDRLLCAAKDSATMLWSKFCLLVAGITGSLDSVADLLGAPQMSDFVNKWVGNPKIIALVMLVISIITMTARKRTL